MIKHLKRMILLGAGFLFVLLGIFGFFLPVMPSIPFFIIASVCFSKSSQKFHNLLMENKWVGPRIRDYHKNNGIKLSEKIFLILLQWSGILITSIFFVHHMFGRILMLCIATGVTVYILFLKTIKE